MATQTLSPTCFETESDGLPAASPPARAAEMRYVARQPILDLRGQVHAYELLFRNPREAVLNEGLAAEFAARTMLDNAVMFGLEWLTNGLPAFVSCTAEAITENLVLVLPPQATVLTLPANLEPTPRLIDACHKLRARGFRLALDDFRWDPAQRRLASLASFIRIDFRGFGGEERGHLERLHLERPGDAPPLLVAGNVDTQRDMEDALAEGFGFFQGEYLRHPVLLKKRKIPASRLLHFELVRLLHHDPMDMRPITRLIMRDASLTFRLLRLVNSPLYAIYQQVRSVEAAILAMGENTFRRVVSLAVLSEMSTESAPEILHMALMRARFCEQAAPLCKLDPSEQYLLGMLSLVPAMLRLPVEDLTPSLPLRAEICDALEGVANPERSLLTWIECHEQGHWDACDALAKAAGIRRDGLMAGYQESAAWAQEAVRSAV